MPFPKKQRKPAHISIPEPRAPLPPFTGFLQLPAASSPRRFEADRENPRTKAAHSITRLEPQSVAKGLFFPLDRQFRSSGNYPESGPALPFQRLPPIAGLLHRIEKPF